MLPLKSGNVSFELSTANLAKSDPSYPVKLPYEIGA